MRWFSHALLDMILLRDKRPDAEVAICFPDFKSYRTLVERRRRSFGLFDFGIYIVTEAGETMGRCR